MSYLFWCAFDIGSLISDLDNDTVGCKNKKYLINKDQQK